MNAAKKALSNLGPTLQTWMRVQGLMCIRTLCLHVGCLGPKDNFHGGTVNADLLVDHRPCSLQQSKRTTYMSR
eukprot:SAG31_NODE_3168_length_4593_cov_205.949933_5_plen_73_part_00